MSKSTTIALFGWVDTADERVAIYWEDGDPLTVSVTGFDCGNQIEEDWLVALLREETGLDVELAGDAGHWNPGEGEGEAIRSIVAR